MLTVAIHRPHHHLLPAVPYSTLKTLALTLTLLRRAAQSLLQDPIGDPQPLLQDPIRRRGSISSAMWELQPRVPVNIKRRPVSTVLAFATSDTFLSASVSAKNLMAECRRRKKLNDRLYLLRSVVPKISKVEHGKNDSDVPGEHQISEKAVMEFAGRSLQNLTPLRKVHKYSKSTTGESWDIVVDEETYYELASRWQILWSMCSTNKRWKCGPASHGSLSGQ